MKKWVAKMFYKNSYIEIHVHYPDRRERVFYTIPSNNTAVVKETGTAYTIDEEKVGYLNGVPCFHYNSGSTVPFNFYLTDENLQMVEMSPEKLYAGIETKLMSEMFIKFSKDGNMNLGLLLNVFTLLLVLGCIVYMFISFKNTNEVLTQIQEVINSLWG